MPAQLTPIERANAFCESYGIRAPILMAPMAGACPPALAAAVANGGGMGACGALLMSPDAIQKWVGAFRAKSNNAFQINLWVPDPEPTRNPAHEAEVRTFLGQWGPDVPADAGDAPLQDFDAQCAAILEAGPTVISSIMGLYDAARVAQFKARGIRWFATVTTVAEALQAEAAGADVIVAQGAEAGGHRGAFQAEDADRQMIGLMSLLPTVSDAVSVPVVATGGIADARGIAAALALGASAVQIGTGLLRTPEAQTAAAWANALVETRPEDTVPTRAFSGRLGRSIRTEYVDAAASDEAPEPAPYPVQRALTQAMRSDAAKADDLQRMQVWAGQSAALARDDPAADLVSEVWQGATKLLAR
ncbi:MAG: nitronate monooxygenase [Pseudomonadota bacterium]